MKAVQEILKLRSVLRKVSQVLSLFKSYLGERLEQKRKELETKQKADL